MKNSHIEWTDHTFNPWEGCTKVSPGCANCYAEARDQRFTGGIHWGKGAPRRRTSEANWKQPLKWDRDARGEGPATLECPSCGVSWHDCECGFAQRKPRVFCASLADWLDDEVPLDWLADLLDLIRCTPHLDWLLLTKRPENWKMRMEDVTDIDGDSLAWSWLRGNAPANVWIGTTVEDQQRADERIPLLLQIPAKVRFLSCEPLLGPVDISAHRPRISETFESPLLLPDWVICGGESGPRARPMHPDWARSLRDQCKAAGVPFFFKQWGEWYPAETAEPGVVSISIVRNKGEPVHAGPKDPEWHTFPAGQQMARVGKKAAGRFLDGVEHNAVPSTR